MRKNKKGSPKLILNRGQEIITIPLIFLWRKALTKKRMISQKTIAPICFPAFLRKILPIFLLGLQYREDFEIVLNYYNFAMREFKLPTSPQVTLDRAYLVWSKL